jgi:hypothetical protein
MTSKLGIALVAATLLAPLSAAFAGETGYFDTAGAPLVPTSHYGSGDAQTTAARQQASGYFATAGAALVEPNTVTSPINAASTIEKQRQSGYFPDAGAPLVTGTIH